MELPTNKSLPRNKQPLKVGLTGGIGAGKSIVAKIFKTIGIPVFDADSVGKYILLKDAVVREEIIELMGDEAYDNEVPNRKFIAQMIFNDDGLRTSLNGIIHPKVANAYGVWLQNNADASYTVKESAIAFETGIYKQMDANILVIAPEELRIARVKARDNTDTEAVKKRMEVQWSDNVKIPLTDFVVKNDQKNGVLPQVLEIHNKLLRLSETKG